MSSNSSQVPYLVMVGVVALVAVVVLLMNGSGSIQGAPVLKKVKVNTFQDGCLDTDSENKYGLFGVVKSGVYEYPDFCGDDANYDSKEGKKVLFQHYCKTGDKVGLTRGYKCPNGCSNGICQ